MDILKNLKSIFIVQDPVAPDNTQTETTASNEPERNIDSTTVTASESKPASSQTTKVEAKVEEKFLNVLYDAIQQHGKEGFDYLEYKQSLTSLAKLSMDEKTRFQSAFAVAQTMGATPNSLTDAAKYYLDVLAKEEKTFEETLKSQMQKQIGDKQTEVEKIKANISEKTKQITLLTKEIEAHQKQLLDMEQQINEASNKIEGTKQNFLASYNQIADQIRSDIEKMNEYLK